MKNLMILLMVFVAMSGVAENSDAEVGSEQTLEVATGLRSTIRVENAMMEECNELCRAL